METLASILAGQGSNPYQQSGQGIAPLLSQMLLNQQMAPSQIGQQAPQAAQGGPQMQPAMPQGAPIGLGMMPQGAGMASPQTAALLQALQGSQTPGG
jgi:hypothetical protein